MGSSDTSEGQSSSSTHVYPHPGHETTGNDLQPRAPSVSFGEPKTRVQLHKAPLQTQAALERKPSFDLKAMILFFFLPTDLVKLSTAQGYFNLYW